MAGSRASVWSEPKLCFLDRCCLQWGVWYFLFMNPPHPPRISLNSHATDLKVLSGKRDRDTSCGWIYLNRGGADEKNSYDTSVTSLSPKSRLRFCKGHLGTGNWCQWLSLKLPAVSAERRQACGVPGCSDFWRHLSLFSASNNRFLPINGLKKQKCSHKRQWHLMVTAEDCSSAVFI